MSDNPYDTPGPVNPGQPFPAGQPGVPPGNAAERLKVPAIGLIVAMGIGLAFAALGLLQNALGVAGIGFGAMPPPGGLDPDAMQQFRGIQMFSGGIGILFGLISIVVGIGVILGAMKMKNLESYNYALTAAILAMVPCLSPCCPLGLVFGIWGIVILQDPQVKAAFRG
jgi:predicted transporter